METFGDFLHELPFGLIMAWACLCSRRLFTLASTFGCGRADGRGYSCKPFVMEIDPIALLTF
jgi:hypothetical protein